MLTTTPPTLHPMHTHNSHSMHAHIYSHMLIQVRPLGKELIRFLGHKVGKTVVSIGIGMASSRFEPGLRQQAWWCVCLLVGWLLTKYALAKEVESKRSKVKSD